MDNHNYDNCYNIMLQFDNLQTADILNTCVVEGYGNLDKPFGCSVTK